MRIALRAPLVTAIREPQRGGSQAFVSDLARGLTGRGHEVHVYAASGSEIPGVEVIDTGIDPRSLAGTLYRAFEPAAGERGEAGPAAAESAFTTAYLAMQVFRYDVVHNHAFDAPAVRLATALRLADRRHQRRHDRDLHPRLAGGSGGVVPPGPHSTLKARSRGGLMPSTSNGTVRLPSRRTSSAALG